MLALSRKKNEALVINNNVEERMEIMVLIVNLVKVKSHGRSGHTRIRSIT